ncbi:MAG: hypothetical protein EOP48_15950, partial [Sphingobacteriales bacterium]
MWVNEEPSELQAGHLILAWANLGSLVEGTMKWFLSVYYDNYKADVDAIAKTHRDGSSTLVDPDSLMFEQLRQFFAKRFWDSSDSWNAWVLQIQQRRNAIHAYQNRDLGNHDDLLDAIRRYLVFV